MLTSRPARRRSLLPVGSVTKDEVRAVAARPRSAHRSQARQPGCLLHPFRRRRRSVSRATAWSFTPVCRRRAGEAIGEVPRSSSSRSGSAGASGVRRASAATPSRSTCPTAGCRGREAPTRGTTDVDARLARTWADRRPRCRASASWPDERARPGVAGHVRRRPWSSPRRSAWSRPGRPSRSTTRRSPTPWSVRLMRDPCDATSTATSDRNCRAWPSRAARGRAAHREHDRQRAEELRARSPTTTSSTTPRTTPEISDADYDDLVRELRRDRGANTRSCGPPTRRPRAWGHRRRHCSPRSVIGCR